MSVVVSIADLPAAIGVQIGWCYLLSVSDDGQARVLAIDPQWVDDHAALRAMVGPGTARNVGARSAVSMVWPPADPKGFTLIADGVAEVDGTILTFRPSSAVMHRPAIHEAS